MLKRNIILFIITAFLLIGCNTTNIGGGRENSISQREPLFRPKDGKKIFFIGQDLETANSYLNSNLVEPSGFITYTNPDDLNGVYKSVDWGYGTVHADSFLNHEKYKDTQKPFIAIGFYMVGMVDNIVAGNYDDNLLDFANWIKKSDSAIFLRIGYEFNAGWCGYSPDTYKEAFKYIVELFNRAGVDNCAYVWQTDGNWGISRSTLNAYYPGDEYVDWCAYSHFGADGIPGTELIQFAKDHGKPVMVAESAPVLDKKIAVGWDVETDSSEALDKWYKPYFSLINSTPEIQAVCYINADWTIQNMWKDNDYFKNTDGRIEYSTIELQDFWNAQFDDNWLIKGSDFSNLEGWELISN